jgi:hypothetical protein
MSETMFFMRFPAEIKVAVYTTKDKNRRERERERERESKKAIKKRKAIPVTGRGGP